MDVNLPDDHCLFWKCFDPIEHDGMCTPHFLHVSERNELEEKAIKDGGLCVRCEQHPGKRGLTLGRGEAPEGLCSGCYSWWRRKHGPAREKILEQERARDRRRGRVVSAQG